MVTKPTRIDLSKYPYCPPPKKSSPSRVVHVIASEAQETGVISNVSKIGRGVIWILEKIEISFKTAGQFVSYLTFLVDSLKVLTGFKYMKDLADQAAFRPKDDNEKVQQNLKTAAGITGVAVAAMTGLKILDGLKITNFSKVTEAVGRVRILGKMAPLIALSPLTNIIEITLASLNIAVGAKKIEQLNGKQEVLSEKQKNWKAFNKEKVKLGKIAQITSKLDEVDTLKKKLRTEESDKIVKGLKASYDKRESVYQAKKLQNSMRSNCCTRMFGHIALFFKQVSAKLAERRYLRVARQHNALCSKYESYEKEGAKLETKLNFWKNVDKASDEDLARVQREKLNQLKVKQVNLRFEKAKEGLGIAFNIVLIAALVTAIVFTVFGIGAVPAALTLTSLFLFVSVFSLGLHLFKKYHKPTAAPKVNLPTLVAVAP